MPPRHTFDSHEQHSATTSVLLFVFPSHRLALPAEHTLPSLTQVPPIERLNAESAVFALQTPVAVGFLDGAAVWLLDGDGVAGQGHVSGP